MRLGVFLPNWIGDCVMATPALRALRNHVGSNGALVGIMRPYVSEVLAGSPWFDQQILYAKRPSNPAHAGAEVRRHLSNARLDAILLMTNSMRTAWMAWRTGVPRRIGYSRDGRGLLLTDRLPWPRSKRHGQRPLSQIDAYLALAYAIGSPQQTRQLELQTTAEDCRLVDTIWDQLQLPPGERLVILNTGSAFGAARDWPSEYWAQLARWITARHEMHVLVNCGPNNRPIARAIPDKVADPQVTSLAEVEHLPIGLAKELIRRCRLLVTTDSGPRFIAVAFARPVVTLFGPTCPEANATHSPKEITLSLDLDCQPCMRSTCPPRHHRCMKDLSVQQVCEAVEAGLKES